MDTENVFIRLVLFFYLVGSPISALAYPEFIGMGYTGCMTCHYNGAGNGGLNDYGRGLFAAEIAAKVLWNKNKSDEDLSASSGFFGKAALPYWFRPSLKYRGLEMEKNPGHKEQSSRRYYQMQQDINLHMAFNEEQTFLLAINLGTVEKETAALPNKTFSETLLLSREYYLRGQMTDNLWFYLGFMDKVYGIRHADHTAINRSFLGLGQNHQVHGLILHYASDKGEIFFNPFIGNLHLEDKEQYPGFSVHYEYEPAEKWRWGLSFMRDRDLSSVEKNTLGFLMKRGIGNGHSLLIETGFKNATLTNLKTVTSFYTWTQATMRMARGLFFQSFMEYFKSDTSKLSAENMRLGAGILAFPFQRVEWRLAGVSGRTLEPTQVIKDSWVLQSQIHFSF